MSEPAAHIPIEASTPVPAPAAGPSPPPLPGREPVEIAFTLTFEEFREALASNSRKPMPPALAWIVRLGTWVSIPLAGALLYFLGGPSPAAPVGSGAGATAPHPDFFFSLMPAAVAAGFVGALVLISRLAAWVTRRVPKGGVRQLLLGLVPLIVAATAYYLFHWLVAAGLYPAMTSASHPVTPTQAIVLALAPWVLLLMILLLVGGSSVRRQWEDSARMRRSHRVRFDDDGLTSDDGVARRLYRWPYFRSAGDTPRLLLLVDEIGRRHLFPKRAFKTREDLQAAMSLIVTHVPDCAPLVRARGFDVGVAGDAVAPRPVLSAEPVTGNAAPG